MKKKLLLLLPLALLIVFTLFAEEPSSPFVFDPNDTEGNRFYNEFFNMLSTLGLVIIVMLLVAWIVRRFGQSRLEQINITSAIKILERRPISPKSSVYLVEVEGTGYVMVEHAHGVTKLGEFELENIDEES